MSGMTSERLEELRRIAEAATPGPREIPVANVFRLNARRIVACVNACDGIPTEALESGVVRELIKAATRYLAATMRESDDDPNCWFEEEFTKAWLREVLAKVRGEADA